jgi:GntR family transcriptional repressor for pyruvate dehydrogenase complex
MLRLGRTSHEELTEARVLLEPPIARLAALRADAEDIRRLEELVAKQEAAIKGNGNPRRYDLEFHRLVADCTKNLPLIIVMNSLADLALEAFARIDIGTDVKRHTVDFHQKVIDAIRRRDSEAAYQEMLRHVRDVQSRLGKVFARTIGDASTRSPSS